MDNQVGISLIFTTLQNYWLAKSPIHSFAVTKELTTSVFTAMNTTAELVSSPSRTPCNVAAKASLKVYLQF